MLFKKEEDFIYDGERIPLQGIAHLENIDYKKLKKVYKECGDIYKAVELLTGRKSNTNKEVENSVDIDTDRSVPVETVKIPIDQIDEVISVPAKEETIKIPVEQIDEVIKETPVEEPKEEVQQEPVEEPKEEVQQEPIEKPVEEKNEHISLEKKILVNGVYLTKREFAKRINMPVLVLEENLHNRKDSDTLQREYFKKDKTIKFLYDFNYNGEPIIDYCAANNIDYTALARFVTSYSIYPDMALQLFMDNHNHIPKRNIEKKYGRLLNYLKHVFSVDIDFVIKTIEEENCDILYALEKYEFNKHKRMDLIDIYDYIMYYNSDPEKKNEIIEKLELKEEKEFLANMYRKMRMYKKQVSLFDMSEYAKDYYQEKRDMVFRNQDLSDEEIAIIYTWFYNNTEENEYSLAA